MCVPGVTPPSITLQKSAGKSSTRVTQLFCVALLSTIRSGGALRSGTPLENAGRDGVRDWSAVGGVSPGAWTLTCADVSADFRPAASCTYILIVYEPGQGKNDRP